MGFGVRVEGFGIIRDNGSARETVPSQTSDMGRKTVSVLVHSFVLP